MAKRPSPSIDYVMAFKDIMDSLILERFSHRENAHILDVGCKFGSDLLRMCSNLKGSKGFGIDIEFKECWAQTNQGRCFFIQSLAEKLPFKNNSFDFIIASEIIEHVALVEDLLDGLYQVLKKDGYLFISTPPRYNYTYLIGKLVPKRFKKLLRKLTYYKMSEKSGIAQILPDGTIIKEHVREYIPSELRKLLNRHGFKVEAIRQGFLRIPFCQLFDRFPFLIKCWAIVDNLISYLPFSGYIKANFIIVARKVD